MGFLESYKYLEKLCGEIMNDDRRISAYIDEMINTPQGAHFVNGWNDDLKQLKHYRWVRNKITHEPACTEQNMCVPGDTQWLNNFYSRIINQTDPLALYTKATSHRPIHNSAHSTYSYPKTAPKTESKPLGYLIYFVLILFFIIVAVIYYMLFCL